MHHNLSLIAILLKKMCNKAVHTIYFTIQFISECYKTQEMCDKAVNWRNFAFVYVLDWYKTQEICDFWRSIYTSTLPGEIKNSKNVGWSYSW